MLKWFESGKGVDKKPACTALFVLLVLLGLLSIGWRRVLEFKGDIFKLLDMVGIESGSGEECSSDGSSADGTDWMERGAMLGARDTSITQERAESSLPQATGGKRERQYRDRDTRNSTGSTGKGKEEAQLSDRSAIPSGQSDSCPFRLPLWADQIRYFPKRLFPKRQAF